MRLHVTPTTAYLPPPPPASAYARRQFNSRTYYTSNLSGTGTTAASIAATGATTTLSILGALSPTLTILGLSLPVVGAAIAGLTAVGIAIASMFKGCGQTCIQATQYANQADSILATNVNHYTSSPVRYASMQAAALNNFDTTWAALQQACNQPSLGQAGINCIADRQAGACHWKASPGKWNDDGTWTPWGAAGSGDACYNWFSGMRDPIANDPFVQPDPVAPTGTSAGTSTTTTGTTDTGILGSVPALTSSVQLGGVSVPLWVLLAGGGLLLLGVME